MMRFLLGLIIGAVLIISNTSECKAVQRDADGKIHRSQTVVKNFKLTTICPSTGSISLKCPGYVVDHIIPLCLDGPDEVDNLQYQELKESYDKDRWEKQMCSTKKRLDKRIEAITI